MIVEKIFSSEYPNLNKKWNLVTLLHNASKYVIRDLMAPFNDALNNIYKSVKD